MLLWAGAAMNLLVFLSISLVFVLLWPVNSQSEREILLNLKKFWGNPPSLASWDSTSAPCRWPEVYCDSGKVVRLNLQGKNISGTIPPTICQLENLYAIHLSVNNISGTIPVSLNACSNLEILDLSSNFLTGPIPGELLLLKNIRRLSLSENKLSGELPKRMQLFKFEHLNLSYNQFHGSIPEDIGNMDNLLELDLSMNSFSGQIPSGLFTFSQLESISLASNDLSGNIPRPMSLSSLYYMNLSHNHLSGTIPRGFENFPQLSLDLSNNQLYGKVSEALSLLGPKSLLQLCSNGFSGRIPYENVIGTYNSYCIDHANLCSYEKAPGFPACSSITHFIIMIAAGIGSAIIGLSLLVFLVKKYSKKIRKNLYTGWKMVAPRIHWRKVDNLDVQWQMIPFQRLDFTEQDILSNLRDENLIGNGGSGKVYRIHIPRIDKTVAVKTICNDRKSTERLEKEFLAEVRILGTIRHKNIVKLLCCISGKNSNLLVYEYLANQSLDMWLHRKRGMYSEDCSTRLLKWPTRLQIAIGAAQGLCYMHNDCSRPIIHRDIKSSNILLDSELNAKIADFGLGKVLARLGDPETASAVAGTFGYIAPEYAYTTKVNTKIDIYSFGVVLLELTTGRKPVDPNQHINLAEWSQQHYKNGNSIVDVLDEKIKEPCNLEEMITVFKLGLMCTEKLPSVRPSMKEILHILQNSMNGYSS